MHVQKKFIREFFSNGFTLKKILFLESAGSIWLLIFILRIKISKKEFQFYLMTPRIFFYPLDKIIARLHMVQPIQKV